MDYRLDPERPLGDEVRRVALEGLDDAIERLGHAGAADRDLVNDVHQSRKRGKETRGLIRLVRPALGDAYAAVNSEVRNGARELSGLRDAHALLGTVEDLRSSLTGAGADELEIVVGRLRMAEAAPSHGADATDARIAVARSRLETARVILETWPGSVDVHALTSGVTKTAKRGRHAWKRVRKDGNDEAIHAWRKGVKYLWYQAQLLAAADPGRIGPIVDDLDELSDLLGHEHDLTVLVEHLERSRNSEAMVEVDVERLVELARSRQATLHSAALDLGKKVYGDGVSVIVERLVGPWSGSTTSTGGSMERERTFLVADMPRSQGQGTRIRQGYLAVDGDVQVRVRERSGQGRTLTVKGGEGGTRTEVEVSIDADQFDQLWPLTSGRRIEKTRHVMPLGGVEAELDVFSGTLAGLVLVEVEFSSDREMVAFDPPSWFGTEVTDDRRYSNAALAERRPDSGAGPIDLEGR